MRMARNTESGIGELSRHTSCHVETIRVRRERGARRPAGELAHDASKSKRFFITPAEQALKKSRRRSQVVVPREKRGPMARA